MTLVAWICYREGKLRFDTEWHILSILGFLVMQEFKRYKLSHCSVHAANVSQQIWYHKTTEGQPSFTGVHQSFVLLFTKLFWSSKCLLEGPLWLSQCELLQNRVLNELNPKEDFAEALHWYIFVHLFKLQKQSTFSVLLVNFAWFRPRKTSSSIRLSLNFFTTH